MRIDQLPDRDRLFSGEIFMEDAIRGVTPAEVKALLTELFDVFDTAVADIDDADVSFVPRDPEATDSDNQQGWPLSHIVCHVTAGLEESAATASTLARGADAEGRPRFEVEWQTIHSVQTLQHRLAESRRMTLAFLDTWPDTPHLDKTQTLIPVVGPLNPIGVLVLGSLHAAGHIEQIEATARQARAAR